MILIFFKERMTFKIMTNLFYLYLYLYKISYSTNNINFKKLSHYTDGKSITYSIYFELFHELKNYIKFLEYH